MADGTIKVYRIEHPDLGTGPYRLDIEQWSPEPHRHYDDFHPTPSRDPHLREVFDEWLDTLDAYTSYDVYYGCESEVALRSWFNMQEQFALDNLGYRLAIYSCPVGTFMVGKYQIVFIKEEATLLETKEI